MKPDELEKWAPEDRSALFRAAGYLSGEAPNPDRVGLCLDTILNDLEAYDDPRQGLGQWLYGNEARLFGELAGRLHAAIGPVRPIEAGECALRHAQWPAVREAAARLTALMRSNGKVAGC